MPDESDAGALFRAGQLNDAIAAVTARVRREPGQPATRVLLAEMLLFAGNLERADLQLDTAASIDPTLAIAVAEFRQLLRAEQARGQLLGMGRTPSFLEEGPTESQRASLACVVAIRAGDLTEAARQSSRADETRAPAQLSANGNPPEDVRDADDVMCGSLEVLTPTGKYLWVPFGRIASLAFHRPERPRDLFWRRATLAVADGPDGDIYVPAIYDTQGGDACRLGRETAWVDLTEGLTRGTGQRLLLCGDEGIPVMEITSLTRAA